MASRSNYSIAELPKPPQNAEPDAKWLDVARKFRDFRLRSLAIAPEAFASTHEAESQRGLDQTFKRLSSPKARQFIAVNDASAEKNLNSDQRGIDDIPGYDWIGMIVLLGPMEDRVTAQADPFRIVASGGAEDINRPLEEAQGQQLSSVEFVLNGVFVEPSARGSGVGRALIDTAVERAKSLAAGGGAGTFVSVLVNAENREARKLYEKAGFVTVGEETYTQEPRALLGEIQAAEKVALKMRLDIM